MAAKPRPVKHLGSIPSIFSNLQGIGYRSCTELSYMPFNPVTIAEAQGILIKNNMPHVIPLAMTDEQFMQMMQELVDNGWHLGLMSFIEIEDYRVFGFSDEQTAVWAKLWEPWK